MLITTMLLSTSAHAEGRTWDLDPAASTLFVLVKHDPNTALAGMAHDHTIAATGWSGSVTWDPDAPGTCAVHIDVPVSGLVVDPPGYRARAGLEGDVPDGDKVKIAENMWGNRQLEKDRFPSISFSSTRCEGSGPTYVVVGDMTIHGVTKQVSTQMTIQADDAGFHASGTLPAALTTWDMSPFTAAMGMIKNLNELAFTIDVKGH
ncbi:MAG: YceI family protein [Alphaproteobacteria bacterium]|nr:YceI family protein [Alphaproteobacteria bacterium]MCB9697256.1 YceI family protein [Alphaproteobacteria bacterium]